VLFAVVLLLRRFRDNRWLWPTALLAGWHVAEHLQMISVYLTTGVAGTPGLLSRGGLIGGGLPVVRPDLHFAYNLIETVPLVAAFAWQLKHSYDEWLARAFPYLSEPLLTETTGALQTLRFGPGAPVVRQGDAADRLYVITRGEVSLTRRTEDGRDVMVRTLGPGQFFGEIGLLTQAPRTATVRATALLEVLALDRETFGRMVESSEATAQDVARIVQQRLATPG
jgi:hypothetical protein